MKISRSSSGPGSWLAALLLALAISGCEPAGETTEPTVSATPNTRHQVAQLQLIDLDTALAMYTRNAAFVMRQDKLTGSIEAGKKADLVVLDRNLFEGPATEINQAKVELTMVGGKVVYPVE